MAQAAPWRSPPRGRIRRRERGWVLSYLPLFSAGDLLLVRAVSSPVPSSSARWWDLQAMTLVLLTVPPPAPLPPAVAPRRLRESHTAAPSGGWGWSWREVLPCARATQGLERRCLAKTARTAGAWSSARPGRTEPYVATSPGEAMGEPSVVGSGGTAHGCLINWRCTCPNAVGMGTAETKADAWLLPPGACFVYRCMPTASQPPHAQRGLNSFRHGSPSCLERQVAGRADSIPLRRARVDDEMDAQQTRFHPIIIIPRLPLSPRVSRPATHDTRRPPWIDRVVCAHGHTARAQDDDTLVSVSVRPADMMRQAPGSTCVNTVIELAR